MKFSEKYFLAANSGEGFVSYFEDNYDRFDGWRAFIIKGGPGTGKSSFMKKIAAKAQYSGLKALLCPCSSDPDSLDAVIIEEKKIIILDGTAPHVVEPQLPGACESIINLGECWNADRLYSSRDGIIEETLKNKALHKAASRYLLAAGQIYTDNLRLAEPCTDTARAGDFALRLCKKLIPEKKGRMGREWPRFIQGITPKGIISFSDAVTDSYNRLVIVSDDYGSVAPVIIDTVRKYALAAGYEIITLKNPIVPSLIYDHLLIPELSLAFVTENSYIHFGGEERRIHARRFMDVASVNRRREKRQFNKKIFRELIAAACELLARAKAVHDDLEGYYISAMDFDGVSSAADKLWEEIIKTL